MGQVIDFNAYRLHRHSNELREINELKRQVVQLERSVHYLDDYMDREQAVIRSMELKMEIVTRSAKLGILL